MYGAGILSYAAFISAMGRISGFRYFDSRRRRRIEWCETVTGSVKSGGTFDKEGAILKIAAAYIRVSTEDQIEYSPESQRKALFAYAGKNGYIIPEEYIFSDEGISGRSTKRPGFQRMIGTAKTKPKPFDAILVWKFSRFARNREDSIVYKSMLRKQCGIEVISISEQLGEDKTSILIEALLEAMDEYYSINLAEEVVRGMSEKARRGGTLGRPAYGYRAENGKVVIDETQAAVVRRIFQTYDGGEPLRRITHAINAEGITTGYGKPWTYRSLEYMLRNPVYTGVTHWTPEKVRARHWETISEQTIITPETHEAIISQELFDRVQERLDAWRRSHPYKAHPGHGHMFPLKGLVRCGTCGSTMVSGGNGGLQCHSYAKGVCKVSHFITMQKLDKLVQDQLEADSLSGNLHVTLAREQGRPPEQGEQMQQAISRLQIQLQRVKEAYTAGIDTLEEYRENKARIQARINALEEQIRKETPECSPDDIQHAIRAAIITALGLYRSDAPDALKNETLRSIIRSIAFDTGRKSVSIEYIF